MLQVLVRSVVDATDPRPAYFHELRRVRVRANRTAATLEVFVPGDQPLPLTPDLAERFNPDARWPTSIRLEFDQAELGEDFVATMALEYVRREGQPQDCAHWIKQPATFYATQWK